MATFMSFLKRGYRQVIGVSEGFIKGCVWQQGFQRGFYRDMYGYLG